MTALSTLIKQLSPVKETHQSTWSTISAKCIKQRVVKQLSEKGLMQAIDRLAFEIAHDSNCCVELGLSDEECDKLLDSRIKQMDNIINIIALSSGIHPTSIDFIVGIRTDQYVDVYVDIIDGDHK
jgi:hypothetical protein